MRDRAERFLWALVGSAATLAVVFACALGIAASGPGSHWRGGLQVSGSRLGYEVHVVTIEAGLTDNFAGRVGGALHEWAESHPSLEVQSFALTSSSGAASLVVLAKPVGPEASKQ